MNILRRLKIDTLYRKKGIDLVGWGIRDTT
jgi:hypothetical protein